MPSVKSHFPPPSKRIEKGLGPANSRPRASRDPDRYIRRSRPAGRDSRQSGVGESGESESRSARVSRGGELGRCDRHSASRGRRSRPCGPPFPAARSTDRANLWRRHRHLSASPCRSGDWLTGAGHPTARFYTQIKVEFFSFKVKVK